MKPASSPPGPLARAVEALASVRLAVVTMAVLGVACIAATLYEARAGTPAAQELFYRTPWFAALLALLGANVLFSMVKRWPWTRHQAGFVIAHVGILTLLGGSLVSLHYGLDGRLALLEGQGSDRIAVEGAALTVQVPGSGPVALPADFREGEAAERRFALPGGGALVVEQFRPHVSVGESLAEGKEWNPALYFTLSGAEMHEHGWLLAAEPSSSHVDFGPVVFGFHAARTAEEARALGGRLHEGNHLCFLLAPDGALSYVIGTRKDGRLERGPATVGQAVATPWMELKLTPDRLLRRAHPVRIVTRAPLPKDGGRRPAVKVRLEGAVAASSDWAVWEEPLRLPTPAGEAVVAYGAPEWALPFRVTLLDFRSETYPGSNRPATFESLVSVEDRQGGRSEHLIAMNHPLHYRGYTFFQASYVQGEPMMSILSVSRSPGLPLVYTGTGLVTLGVLWMFYLKPAIARRQARRALEARTRPQAGAAPAASRA